MLKVRCFLDISCKITQPASLKNPPYNEHEEENENAEEDETKDDGKELTVEQVAGMRHILINDSRDKALEKGHDFASCGQAQQGISMFDTNKGNFVCERLASEASLL